MFLRYFYHSKLAHASYMVGCQAVGQAIVVDPGRNIDIYLAEAKNQGLKIVAATETHIHADFVSGIRELAEQTGATLYVSDEGDENWKYQYLDGYKFVLLKDGQTFKIGNIQFEVMHTPGHTPEHISFLVTDTAGANKPMGIFSGDFVFVGDVGRPDLLEKAAGVTGASSIGAHQLFQSIKRFKQLPDYMQVWPAHGAGSACGKALGAIPSSTVGYEKLFNAALSFADEGQFVKAILSGQPAPPKYFAEMKRVNKQGPAILSQLTAPKKLNLNDLKTALAQNAPIIDLRPAKIYGSQHIPGTINIPYDESFLTWAGWLINYNQPFYLIAPPEQISAITADLAYIGLDAVAGYFSPDIIGNWQKAGGVLQAYQNQGPPKVKQRLSNGPVNLIDVRNDDEWAGGRLAGARHIMLGQLTARLNEIERNIPVIVHCQSGMRSAIGASILQANGFNNVTNMLGGFEQWVKDGLPVER